MSCIVWLSPLPYELAVAVVIDDANWYIRCNAMWNVHVTVVVGGGKRARGNESKSQRIFVNAVMRMSASLPSLEHSQRSVTRWWMKIEFYFLTMSFALDTPKRRMISVAEVFRSQTQSLNRLLAFTRKAGTFCDDGRKNRWNSSLSSVREKNVHTKVFMLNISVTLGGRSR